MKNTCMIQAGRRKKRILYQDGRLYFSKETERKFYFILTMIMLVAGILYKTGIL